VTVDEGASSEKLAAVINQMERPITEEIFAELNRSMPEDIKRLRGLVFMFEDIVNLEQKDRSKLFDRAPTDQVIPALFGCTAELREAILSSLSARSRRMVESELQGDTSQPQPGTAAAQRKLADLAIQMSKAGEITLRSAPPADGPAATAAAPEAA
jgi:flagellar motor switch protein FliG